MLTGMTDEDWMWCCGCSAPRGPGAATRVETTASSSKRCTILCSQHHMAGPACGVWPLELCVEALLASEPGGGVRGLLRGARCHQPHRPSRADVRLHHRAGACLGGGSQRGQQSQALGRSRGGFSTKIHLKTDLRGLPLAFELTEGQASDSPMFEVLLDLGPDIKPRAAVGDKGYANRKNRAAARDRAICPVIPYKAKEKNPPRFFAKVLYRARARIEQLVGKLKRFKRIALRSRKRLATSAPSSPLSSDSSW